MQTKYRTPAEQPTLIATYSKETVLKGWELCNSFDHNSVKITDTIFAPNGLPITEVKDLRKIDSYRKIAAIDTKGNIYWIDSLPETTLVQLCNNVLGYAN
jgi:hypothetical protein